MSEKKSHIEPTQEINLKVGTVRMTLSIPRDEAYEHVLRKGAERVNAVIERYRSQYTGMPKEELLCYVALHLASQLLRCEVRSAELDLEKRLTKLNQELEQVF